MFGLPATYLEEFGDKPLNYRLSSLITSHEFRLVETLYHEVMYYKNHIGYFPNLAIDIINGFSWGDNQNYSYAREPGYPNLNAILTTKKRIELFLQTLMSHGITDKTVIMQSPVKCDEIQLVDGDFLKNAKKTDQGVFATAAALVTLDPEVTLTIPPSDCRVGIISAKTKNGIPLLGFIHHSRRSTDLRYTARVIAYLNDEFGCLPNTLKVGITPGLSDRHHLLDQNGLENANEWGEFIFKQEDGCYKLDLLGYLIKQYQDCGVLNIEAYSNKVCTYDLSENSQALGFSTSHRFCLEHPDINESRMLIAACLRKLS